MTFLSISVSLRIVERLSFHCDVLSKIFVTFHAFSEVLVILWLLAVVERLALHCDVLAKVLISLHSLSEKFVVFG